MPSDRTINAGTLGSERRQEETMGRGSGRYRRWRMAILIFMPIACAGAGAYLLQFGFGPPWRTYRSEGLVRWPPPPVPSPGGLGGYIPVLRERHRFQLLLTSPRALRVARQDAVWQSAGRSPDEARLELAADGPDGIRVRSRSSDPVVAAAGVMAAVDAFRIVLEEEQRARDREE